MKVIVPLAGKGTRLLPLTKRVPKPLVRVAGRPVMDYVMDAVKGLDVEELIVITGHLLDVEPFHRVHDVVHDRSPGDAYQGLRDPLGERQEPRALSGEGNDDFHVTPVRSGL